MKRIGLLIASLCAAPVFAADPPRVTVNQLPKIAIPQIATDSKPETDAAKTETPATPDQQRRILTSVTSLRHQRTEKADPPPPDAPSAPIRSDDAVVMPEVATPIEMSSSDINRITCVSGPIKDVIYSKEKGIIVRYSDRDAYLKFVLRRGADGKEIYATTPAEVFLVCGDDVYNIVAFPRRVVSKTVRLASSSKQNIRKNREYFAGMPYEQKILAIIRGILTDTHPESFTVTQENRSLPLYRDVNVTLRRTFRIEGEGLNAREYMLTPAEGVASVDFEEREFVRPEFASNPIAITLEKTRLKTGDTTRLIVVERTSEGDRSNE